MAARSVDLDLEETPSQGETEVNSEMNVTWNTVVKPCYCRVNIRYEKNIKIDSATDMQLSFRGANLNMNSGINVNPDINMNLPKRKFDINMNLPKRTSDINMNLPRRKSPKRKLAIDMNLPLKNHSDPLTSHRCDVCDKFFVRISHLNRHKLTHSSKQPFQCKICAKKFKMEIYLNQHLKDTVVNGHTYAMFVPKGFLLKVI